MRVDRVATLLCLLAAGVSLCGCAARLAPRGWLPYAQEAQHEGYGGWIEVAAGARPSDRLLSGELLAVSDDSVFVLTSAGATSCALADVLRATLEGYDPRSGDTARMTLAGTLTSWSTGFGLIVMAPLWIVVGSAATSKLSDDGRIAVDDSQPSDAARRSWKDMRLFARFPQGVPVALDRSQLRLRHVKRVERTKPKRWGE